MEGNKKIKLSELGYTDGQMQEIIKISKNNKENEQDIKINGVCFTLLKKKK